MLRRGSLGCRTLRAALRRLARIVPCATWIAADIEAAALELVLHFAHLLWTVLHCTLPAIAKFVGDETTGCASFDHHGDGCEGRANEEEDEHENNVNSTAALVTLPSACHQVSGNGEQKDKGSEAKDTVIHVLAPITHIDHITVVFEVNRTSNASCSDNGEDDVDDGKEASTTTALGAARVLRQAARATGTPPISLHGIMRSRRGHVV